MFIISLSLFPNTKINIYNKYGDVIVEKSEILLISNKEFEKSKIDLIYESKIVLNDDYILYCRRSMDIKDCSNYLSLFFKPNNYKIKVKPYFMSLKNKMMKSEIENENNTIIMNGPCHSDGKRLMYNINISNNNTKINSSEMCKCSMKNMKSEESECKNNKKEIKYIWKDPKLCDKDEELYETERINCCIIKNIL